MPDSNLHHPYEHQGLKWLDYMSGAALGQASLIIHVQFESCSVIKCLETPQYLLQQIVKTI